MTQPLAIGQVFATLERRFATDPELRVVSNGQAFEQLSEAEARAHELATTSMVDAIVVGDGRRFWVYAVDEVVVRGRALDTDVRGKVRPTLREGITLQTFMATYRAPDGQKLGAEKVAAADDPVPAFVGMLERAGVPGLEVRLLRRGEIHNEQLRAVRDALTPRAKEPTVAAVLPQLDAALAQTKGGQSLRFDELATAAASPVVAPGAHGSAVRAAETWFVALRESATLTLDSVPRNHMPALDLVRGALNPTVAARGYLAVCAYSWSVLRDLRSGALSPTDFGKPGWDDVDTTAVFELAAKRLADQRYDGGELASAMSADPMWVAAPVLITDPKGALVELRTSTVPKPIDSTVDMLGDALAGGIIARLPLTRSVVASVAAARPKTAGEAALAAQVATAHGLHLGQGIAADSAQAPLVLAAATGVSLVRHEVLFDVDPEELATQKRSGAIASFEIWHGVALVTTLKPVRELAREAAAIIEAKDSPLPQMTREQLRALVRNDGAELAKALADEHSARRYRSLAGEVLEVGNSIGLSVVGGSIFARLAAHAGTGVFLTRAANAVGTSLTFTTAEGLRHGELTTYQYAKDLALFAPLAAAGALAKIGARIAPGTGVTAWLGRQGIEHGGVIVASSATAAAFLAFEAARLGGTVSKAELQREMARTAVVLAAVQGFSAVAGRFVRLAEHSAGLRQELNGLHGQVSAARNGWHEAHQRYESLYRAYVRASGAQRQALDEPMKRAAAELRNAGEALEARSHEITSFTQRYAPALGLQRPASTAGEARVPRRADRGPPQADFSREPPATRKTWDTYHPQRRLETETDAQVHARLANEAKLLEHYRPQLDDMVRQTRVQHRIAPGHELLDVERGLLDALRTFDPTKRATFLDHAHRHVKTDLVLERRGTRAVEALAAPGYKGPRPGATVAEQRLAAETFLRETFTHRRDVMVLNSHAGGRQVPNHDVVEHAKTSDLRALVDRLGHDAPEWMRDILSAAERSGKSRVEVGKLVPEVLAGLAQRGRPDRGAIEFHNLSGHHRPDGPATEVPTDRINSMRQPRDAYRQYAFTSTEIDRIVTDMHQKGQMSASQLGEHRRILELQLDLERRGYLTSYGGRERRPSQALPSRDAGGGS
jgi:hypothetical protein